MTSNTHDRYRRKRLFEIGALEFSKGVENLMLEGRLDPIPYLERYMRGDWGEVDDDQWQQNNAAVQSGKHLDSHYVVTRELSIDFVVHGDQGVAAPWAANAAPGDPAYLMGPNGAYSPDPAADWYLFAGDEAAIPAIGVALAALPADAIGQAFIEVAGPDDEIALAAPDGVIVTWVHRGGRADLVGDDAAGDHAPLIGAVTNAPWLPGLVQVFIHGEAQTVMHNLRPYIRKVRGVDATWASSISGYWRRGRTEETFRQWKRELAEAEA